MARRSQRCTWWAVKSMQVRWRAGIGDTVDRQRRCSTIQNASASTPHSPPLSLSMVVKLIPQASTQDSPMSCIFTPQRASPSSSIFASPNSPDDTPTESPQRHPRSPRRCTPIDRWPITPPSAPVTVTATRSYHESVEFEGHQAVLSQFRVVYIHVEQVYESNRRVKSSSALTAAQKRHQLPARPPPPGASAAAWHEVQFSPIRPMISMSEMLRRVSGIPCTPAVLEQAASQGVESYDAPCLLQ